MSDVRLLDDGNFGEATASGVVVVDFYTDTCGPCKMMAPIFEEARDEYAGRAEFAKLNVYESMGIATEYRVMGVPTLIFFKGGQAVDRVVGVIDKNTLCAKIDALL